MNRSHLIAPLLLLLTSGAFAEDRIVNVPAATVHSKPSASAECVTQVPMNDSVHVVKEQGAWLQVVVKGQYRLEDGYPGWVLKSQTDVATGGDADSSRIVLKPAVALKASPSASARTVSTAYLGSELATNGHEKNGWIEVHATCRTGKGGWVPVADVSEEPLTATGADIVRMAKTLTHTHYLWGGISVDGIDCSGLTYMVYRAHGITLPRDADQQFLVGTEVDRKDLQPGDMLFYGKNKENITHVGIYAGNGQMVEANSKLNAVTTDSMERRADYQGARRVIGVTLTMPPGSP